MEEADSFPEHSKMTYEVEASIQTIGNFLECVGEKGWFLTEGANDGSTWNVPWDDVQKAMAEFHGIDYAAYLAEKEKALEMYRQS